MARVAVIGAGVGGLASAIRLADAGHEVQVYEKNETAGGKLATQVLDGFRFDIGPSLLTMPQYFDELGVVFDRVRLAEPFLYRFRDGKTLSIDDSSSMTRTAFETIEKGAGDQWQKLIQHGERIWSVSERTFFAGAMSSPVDLLRRMRTPKDFAEIDALRRLHTLSRKAFASPHLQQWLDRYATYSGSSPYRAPATLSCIPFLEHHFGCWHVPGGLTTIATAMVERARQAGVIFHFNTEVTRIEANDAGVHAIRFDDSRVRCDLAVADINASRLYGQLLAAPNALRRLKRAPLSTAGFAMLLGISDKTPDMRHHNVWFSRDYALEFDQIERAGVADDPTVYVCNSSVTTEAEAPTGSENWFVLTNVRAGATTDWTRYGDHIIDRLGLRERVVLRQDLTPQFYADRYADPGGAIYGSSSNGKRAAFLRANNRGVVPGLYLVGGSSHPGGGLPLVMSSARIVNRLIEQDGWKS